MKIKDYKEHRTTIKNRLTMNYKYILIIFSFFCTIVPAKAQVVIGADKSPESFSILEIESTKGGVRLPRIPETDKVAMAASLTGNDKSKGIVIYNSTNNVIEFWDGDEWVVLSDKIVGENGLTDANSRELMLGGTLKEDNTVIDMDNNKLQFTHNSSAKFIVNDTMVVVNNKVVDVRVDKNFSINDTVIDISDKYIDMRPALLSINNGAFKMGETERINIEGSFKYSDGTESLGYLLTANNKGDAHWGALRPLGATYSKNINNSQSFGASSVTVSNSAIQLPPGQWLIFAKFNSKMTASRTGMYHWIEIHGRKKGETDYQQKAMSGYNPEKRGSGTSYATPFLMHYVNIKETSEYIVKAGTSNGRSDATVSLTTAGDSYFYAMRIDIPSDYSPGYDNSNLKIICPSTISIKYNTGVNQTATINYTLTTDAEKVQPGIVGFIDSDTKSRFVRADVESEITLTPSSGSFNVKLSGTTQNTRPGTSGADYSLDIKINNAYCTIPIKVTR